MISNLNKIMLNYRVLVPCQLFASHQVRLGYIVTCLDLSRMPNDEDNGGQKW